MGATPMRANTLDDWHRRLGHLNYRSIRELEASGVVTGLRIHGNRHLPSTCEICALGKISAAARPRTKTTPRHIHDQICHVDLAGPFKPSIHKNKYYMLLRWRGYKHVYFLKTKSDSAIVLADYFNMLSRRKHPVGELFVLRSDKGGEFESSQVKQVGRENEIKQQVCEP
ncbi:TPA: hypothetical protein N0F65_009517 [Lagenidium giganteum]|uniref:Integrase catalytic domain-containing protein n=1 Tax=Lagenidium giganteum TaxID=4803 RepID=A0AAV2YU13_9STRA|nr:TPA: hypothetical protein N0F65_009517 [Lagenidium giganteum]